MDGPVEIYQLRYFVALAEELNFTRAAASPPDRTHRHPGRLVVTVFPGTHVAGPLLASFRAHHPDDHLVLTHAGTVLDDIVGHMPDPALGHLLRRIPMPAARPVDFTLTTLPTPTPEARALQEVARLAPVPS